MLASRPVGWPRMQSSTSLRVIGYLTGALGIVLLAWTLALRIASPWPLEWMEGASLQHAIRIAHGLPLYAAPSAEFIPYLYPPLAYVPMAAAVGLLGSSLWVGRLISVIAAAGSVACVFVTARRSAGSAAIGCWAAGVYALGFGYNGAFWDLVRVDSVFMLLVLLGIERLSARSYATGLIWLVLGCFAKQHGVVFLAAAAGGLLWTEGRRVGQQLMAAVGALLAGTAALQANSGGYYLKYTASVPAGQGLEPKLLLSYFAVDVLVYLPVLAALSVAGFWRARRAAEMRWSELPDDELNAVRAKPFAATPAESPVAPRNPQSAELPRGAAAAAASEHERVCSVAAGGAASESEVAPSSEPPPPASSPQAAAFAAPPVAPVRVVSASTPASPTPEAPTSERAVASPSARAAVSSSALPIAPALESRGLSAPLLFLLLAAGLAASALGRAHPGGFDNVRMPGFALLVLAAAAELPATWSAASRALRLLVGVALVAQPLLLLQLPAAHAPRPADAAAFQTLEDSLRRCGDGDLAHAVALDHSLLTSRPFLHTMALSDLRLSSDAEQLAAAGTSALIAALNAADAPKSIAASATFPELEQALATHYDECERLPPMHFATGYQLLSTIVYRRKP